MADGVGVTPGVGATAATDEVANQHYQRIKRSVGADGAATDFLDKASRSDTFTVTGQGGTVDVSAQAMSRFAIQVKYGGTGAPTWTVVLEGSLNNVNFTTIITHTDVIPADGKTQWQPAPAPCLYFRARVAAISLGGATNLSVTILGVP